MKKYKVHWSVEKYRGSDQAGEYEIEYPSHMSKEEVYKIEQARNLTRLVDNYDLLGIAIREVTVEKQESKPLSLLERRKIELEKQALTKKLAEDEEERKRKAIADKIIGLVDDPKIRAVWEERLVKYGCVTINAKECLCTMGFCAWKAGYHKYLKEFEARWAKEGLSFHYNSNGISIFFSGRRAFDSYYSLDTETLKFKGK